MSNFYFTEDAEAGERNSVGALFVVKPRSDEVVLYCDEHDTFWRSLAGDRLADTIPHDHARHRRFRAATLREIEAAGWLEYVDGVHRRDLTLKVPRSG